MNKTMHIVPPGCVGNKRALLIGINYVGQKGALKACHNDVRNMRDFLRDVHGFQERDMLLLMDDGEHKMPTKKNIETGFRILTSRSKPGDVVFVMFSGRFVDDRQHHVLTHWLANYCFMFCRPWWTATRRGWRRRGRDG